MNIFQIHGLVLINVFVHFKSQHPHKASQQPKKSKQYGYK